MFDVQTGVQILTVLINVGLLILAPIVLYFIVKLAVKHGINASKLFKQDK